MGSIDSAAQPNQISAEVDPTHAATRVSIRPLDLWQNVSGRSLGYYNFFSQLNTANGFNAGGNFAAFRWTDPNAVAVISRIYVTLLSPAGTQTFPGSVAMFFVRGYAKPDTTNSTQVVIDNEACRKGMGTSLMQLWFSTASAGISGGVKTVSTQAMSIGYPANMQSSGVSGTPAEGQIELYKWDQWGQHPIVLGFNEGLIFSGNGSSLRVVGLGMHWAEAAGF